MPCFAALLAFISPRLAIIFVAIFSDILSRAYDSWFLPFIGFFILPWTTLAYATMWSISSNQVTGYEWAFVGVAVLLDLWAWSAFRR
jgi:hypothetical protein